MKKKTLAILLALSMMVSMIPTAFAVEGDPTVVPQTGLTGWVTIEEGTADYKISADAATVTVTADVTHVGPEGATFSYQWKTDSNEWAAGDKTYTISDDTETIQVRVVGTGNYEGSSIESNPYTIVKETAQPEPPIDNDTTLGGGTTTPSTTVSGAQTDKDAGTTTVEMDIDATTVGTVASATVGSFTMNSAVNRAVNAAANNGTAPVVEIKLTVSTRATSLNLTLPTAALKTLAKAEGSALAIKSTLAEVTLDNTALAALADEVIGGTVTLKVAPVAAASLTEEQQAIVGDAAVIDLSMLSNGKAIHDYKDGKITISLPYKLEEGQDGKNLQVYYLPEEGEAEGCPTSYADGKVTFTTGHLSMYFVSAEWENPYTDVDKNDPAYDAIRFVTLAGLMKGYADTDGNVSFFGPADTFNRAQMAQVLFNMTEGAELDPDLENIFTDVPDDEWYPAVIAWAANEGLVEGYGRSTLYGPTDGVTIEQVLVMLSRRDGEKLETVLEPENDTVELGEITCSGWAENFVQWGIDEGIIDGELNAAAEATRAQIAQILMNYCNK